MKISPAYFFMAFAISTLFCACGNNTESNKKETVSTKKGIRPHKDARDFKISAYLEVNDGTTTKVYQVEDRRNDDLLSSLNKDGNRYSSFGLTDAKKKDGPKVNLHGGLTIDKDGKGTADFKFIYLDGNALQLMPVKPQSGTHTVSNIQLFPVKNMKKLANVSFRYDFKNVLMEDNIQKVKNIAAKDNSTNYQYTVSGYYLCEPNN